MQIFIYVMLEGGEEGYPTLFFSFVCFLFFLALVRSDIGHHNHLDKMFPWLVMFYNTY